MKKVIYCILVIGLFFIIFIQYKNNILAISISDLENTNKQLNIKIETLEEENKQLQIYKNIYDGFESIDIHTDARYYDIPLTFEQQEFVQYIAEENGFSETFIYALMQSESGFDVNAVSYNQTSYGIMQINKSYVESASKLAGLEDYDIMNFYDNVKMGIAILRYNRDYYINKGYDSQEDLTHLTLSSFNRGINGLRKKMDRDNSPISAYSENVLNNKMEIEQSLSDNN